MLFILSFSFVFIGYQNSRQSSQIGVHLGQSLISTELNSAIFQFLFFALKVCILILSYHNLFTKNFFHTIYCYNLLFIIFSTTVSTDNEIQFISYHIFIDKNEKTTLEKRQNQKNEKSLYPLSYLISTNRTSVPSRPPRTPGRSGQAAQPRYNY